MEIQIMNASDADPFYVDPPFHPDDPTEIERRISTLEIEAAEASGRARGLEFAMAEVEAEISGLLQPCGVHVLPFGRVGCRLCARLLASVRAEPAPAAPRKHNRPDAVALEGYRGRVGRANFKRAEIFGRPRGGGA